eukprot:TRINITY_DN44007_c0_g1_i1.p1 TRINITY_DN44007_c0_g1~~TRINITY_DN44007_c0_g1_i1.p1  ORF type:complete len:410 (-),score=45.37 TRINITY_DN44007_c0_g1_i1:19-1194(-)
MSCGGRVTYSAEIVGHRKRDDFGSPTLYHIRVHGPTGTKSVWRTYSAFDALWNQLSRTGKFRLPAMPAESFFFRRTFLSSFDSEQQKGLGSILQSIMSADPEVTSPSLQTFLDVNIGTTDIHSLPQYAQPAPVYAQQSTAQQAVSARAWAEPVALQQAEPVYVQSTQARAQPLPVYAQHGPAQQVVTGNALAEPVGLQPTQPVYKQSTPAFGQTAPVYAQHRPAQNAVTGHAWSELVPLQRTQPVHTQSTQAFGQAAPAYVRQSPVNPSQTFVQPASPQACPVQGSPVEAAASGMSPGVCDTIGGEHFRGMNAPLTEAGYASVTDCKDNIQMALFIRRVASSLGYRIASDDGLDGLVPFHSGAIGKRSFAALTNELQIAAGDKGCCWIVPV